ncbi:OLC1v1026595C2 [Oldenlandia corymbosa var. corymbosa]|nr:OLC1v1026595C2 [Oldenlandia corymbosa var. corymbosa]
MAAAIRSVLNRTKPWDQGNKLVKWKLSVLGVVGCIHNSPNVVGLKDLTVLPFPACRRRSRCYGSQPTPLSRVNIGPDFNYGFTPVSCAADDKGVLSATHYAVAAYPYLRDNKYAKPPPIRVVRVVNASVIRSGWSIYNLTLEGIPENGDLNIYRALVVHDPVQKKKILIDFQLLNDCPSRRLDSLENAQAPSAVTSDVIVPVDIENNEQIYEYALSAAQLHTRDQENKSCLEKVLSASKLEVCSVACYLLILRAKDYNGDCSTLCAITKLVWVKQEKKHFIKAYVSKPLEEYQVGLGA